MGPRRQLRLSLNDCPPLDPIKVEDLLLSPSKRGRRNLGKEPQQQLEPAPFSVEDEEEAEDRFSEHFPQRESKLESVADTMTLKAAATATFISSSRSSTRKKVLSPFDEDSDSRFSFDLAEEPKTKKMIEELVRSMALESSCRSFAEDSEETLASSVSTCPHQNAHPLGVRKEAVTNRHLIDLKRIHQGTLLH